MTPAQVVYLKDGYYWIKAPRGGEIQQVDEVVKIFTRAKTKIIKYFDMGDYNAADELEDVGVDCISYIKAPANWLSARQEQDAKKKTKME